MSITICGASDDLIEVEGDLREEFSYEDHMGAGDLIAFSDGTVLRVEFGQSWRITPVARGTAVLIIDHAVEIDEDSDRATLDGEITWVAQCITLLSAKGLSR